MKIAFRHVPFDDAQKKELNELAAKYHCETFWFPQNAPLPTAEDLKKYDVLMGYFPPEVMQELPNLKWIQTPSAGVERLCNVPYSNPDVILTNCSGAFGIAISEYMITGLLMLMRNMPAYMENQKQHLWKEMGLCRSIYGSKIAVIGMGNIGANFAKRAKAMGAYVRGVRRTVKEKPEYFDEVFTSEQINEAVADCDAVVMCLPGTSATTQMVSADTITHMSEKTILINCGRGCTLDQEALTQALANKKIAGAVLDVCAVEPLPADHPLWDMPQVIITPHISGHDDDPINAVSIFEVFKENLFRYFTGQPLTHVINRATGY